MKKIILIPFLFFILIQTSFGQSSKINGTVTNAADGSPIPGVNVTVAGTKAGVSTSLDGKYVINAEQGATLNFSFIGFNSKSVSVGNSSQLNVSLSENQNTLDQVVVVGSTIKTSRKELGNAITSVKSKELMRAQPNSLSSALQGKVAGAQISQNSGDPSGGFSIKLRGTSSLFGSSDPLYVIDGVVMNNASTNVTNLSVTPGNSNIRLGQNRSVDINPNDIENIEIINGSSAAAIYGARASNGVILITTKKGVAGKQKFSFSTASNINVIRKKLNTNLVNKQFESTAAALFPINGTTYVGPTVTTVLGRAFDSRLKDVVRYDYQDDIFNTGVGSDTYFSVQGGNELTKYSTSLSYMSNEGIVRNTDFKRLGLKLNLQHIFNPKFSISFGLNYINSWSNEKPDGNVFYSPLNSVTITNNIYNLSNRDINGNLKAVDPGRVNPLSVIETFKITQATDRIISDVQLNYKPFKNLNADFVVGVDTYNQKGNVLIPRFPYSPVNTFAVGYVSEANNKVSQFNNDFNIRYLWNISENVKSTSYVGYNTQIYRDEFVAEEGTDLKPFIQSINAYNTVVSGSPRASRQNFNIWGYFFQQTFGFYDKLFLTGAIRQDASTNFSKENRTQYYPKVSGSYVLSNEKFMKNSIVSSARFRASWGESGNLTAISAYDRFTSYSGGSLPGSLYTFTLDGNRQGNLNIKPERSVSLEYGFDIGLFKDKFNFSFSYYNVDINDLLLPVQSAPSAGFTSTIDNLGEMNNKGFEASIKYNIIDTDNFKLSTIGTLSANRNKVTALTQQRFSLDNNPAGAPVFVEVGEPIGIFYGTYYATNPDGSLLLNPAGFPQGEKGDANNVPQRDAVGQPTGAFLNKKIGDPNPDYVVSFGTNMNYKKFGLSILFDGVQGVDVFDADYRTRQGVGSGELVAKELNGELPRGYIWSIYNIQEFRVVDGSYIKLREIALNYSFGKFNKFFDDLTITASGRNLYSWDKFPSYDPETNSGGQSSVARYNFGTIPIPSTYSLALKFMF